MGYGFLEWDYWNEVLEHYVVLVLRGYNYGVWLSRMRLLEWRTWTLCGFSSEGIALLGMAFSNETIGLKNIIHYVVLGLSELLGMAF